MKRRSRSDEKRVSLFGAPSRIALFNALRSRRERVSYFFTLTTTLPPGVSVIVFGSGCELPLSESGSLATTGRS